MKIYKFSEEVFFEFDEYEQGEDFAGYIIKVKRFIAPIKPDFKFSHYSYFKVSFAAWAKKVEVSEEEFKDELEKITTNKWKSVCKLQTYAPNDVIMLDPLAVSTRYSYMETYYLTPKRFSEWCESKFQI